MKLQSSIPFWTAAVVAGTVSTLSAQTPAVNQNEAVNQRRRDRDFLDEGKKVSDLYPGESEDTGTQNVLTLGERRTHFEVMLDSELLYTSNMFYEERRTHETDTSLSVNTAQFSLAPQPYPLGSGEFAPRIGIRHQWYFYGLENWSGKLNNFNFNAQTAFMDWRYRMGLWTFEAGGEATRLLRNSDYDEFYREAYPFLGVRRSFPVNDRAFFATGYRADYRFTRQEKAFGDRNDLDRLTHSLYLAYTQQVGDRFLFQPYYRLQLAEFSNQSRVDQLHTVGCAGSVELGKNFTFRIFAAYDLRESSNPAVPDYRRIEAGGGANFTYRF